MGLRTDELDFDLDPALIADHPAEPRESARLLVVGLPSAADDDGTTLHLSHRTVADLPDLLRSGDRLVLNATRVVPARIHCRRADTGGRLEGLLAESDGPGRWWAMLRKSRRLQPGHQLDILDRDGRATSLRLAVRAVDDEGRVLVELQDTADPTAAPAATVARLHREAGLVPLPPYILRARRERGLPEDDPHDPDWYQTTFAESAGPTESVAAPTAGLHLTPRLLAEAEARGVRPIRVSLEVGAGTFKPVEVEDLSAHPMHAERCVVAATARAMIEDAAAPRARGEARLVAVGTTSVRTLESMPDGPPGDLDWATDLLIQPGHRFRRTDAILTNFHLPRSTLLALVAAMTGLDRLHRIYAEAIAHRYRFFSYGDAMLIHRSQGGADDVRD
jgi:S-adenosylmethionine:tRNA ribosyltransferase-isomerase